jgi:hypothetical protein
MDNKRYVEERIRKIDGFLLAVNSKIERILEENDNHPRVSVVFGSKILDISLYTDTVAALQDLICAEKKVWEEVLSGLKDG